MINFVIVYRSRVVSTGKRHIQPHACSIKIENMADPQSANAASSASDEAIVPMVQGPPFEPLIRSGFRAVWVATNKILVWNVNSGELIDTFMQPGDMSITLDKDIISGIMTTLKKQFTLSSCGAPLCRIIRQQPQAHSSSTLTSKPWQTPQEKNISSSRLMAQ